MTTPTKLYRHFDASGALLYVGISVNALTRLQQHNEAAHWANNIANVTIETHPTREAAQRAEKAAIRTENPAHNLMRYVAESRTNPARRSKMYSIEGMDPEYLDLYLWSGKRGIKLGAQQMEMTLRDWVAHWFAGIEMDARNRGVTIADAIETFHAQDEERSMYKHLPQYLILNKETRWAWRVYFERYCGYTAAHHET